MQADRRQEVRQTMNRPGDASAAVAPTGPDAHLSSAMQALHNTTFEQLVQAAEQLGTNRGHPGVIGLYRTWIALHSGGARNLHAAWFNLGVELARGEQPQDAILAYRAALALKPDFVEAAINLGLQLEQSGQTEAALQSWTQALQPDAARVALINHRGRLLEQAGRLEEAEQALRSSLLTDPQQPDVIQHWVHIRQKMCQWPVLDESVGLSRRTLLESCGPLAALALSDQVDVQNGVNARWIGRKTMPIAGRLSPEQGYRHGRIRLGYMSSDFCRHAMSYLIAELFERHDRDRFEIFGYCSSPDDGSEIRARVVAAFDRFRPIRGLADEAAARLIRSDEIDILVDLNGLTAGSRLQILRWRPAPVQATYLGFIGPVPLPELDYLFCDEFVVPPAMAAAYQPRPLYVAHTYQANDSRRALGAPTTRAETGLPEDRFVFCCFSNHYKITEEMFGAWMLILGQAEHAVLWLTADNAWSCRNLRRRAAASGIDPDRLIFADRTDPSHYIARLRLADLFLDTFPYNAGTIASDALRMGLPVLTRMGDAFASRMASRLLCAIGAECGVTLSLESYVDRAVALATDAREHAAYRSMVTEARWADTIGDIAGFTAQFEASLVRLQAECRGRPVPVSA